MDSKNTNKILLVLALSLGFILMAAAMLSSSVLDHVADRVIQKLQREYSPSPYGPGIDPDKIDINKIKPNSKSAIKTIYYHDF